MAAPTTARRPVRRDVTAPRPQRAPSAPNARPRLRLVDDARLSAAQRRRRARFIAIAAGVLAAGTLLLLAASNAMLVSGQARIDHLQKQVAEEQATYSANRLKVAQLSSPEHVVQVARDKLGMVPPPGVTYLSPSETMAAQVQGGTGKANDTQSAAPKKDGGSSWAATKPYLGANP